MHRLCQAIHQQPEFYEKLGSGVQQLCDNYELGDLSKPFEEESSSQPANDEAVEAPSKSPQPTSDVSTSAGEEASADAMEIPVENESDKDVEMKDEDVQPTD